MIKVRVIPQLLVADGLLKKPIRFQRPRTIASPISIARVFEARQVDELILLDIGCAAHHTNINPEVVAMISDELTVPLSVGGGVRDLETASRLIAAGAEKVVINSAAVETPELIGEIASRFGSQCTLVSIDAKPLGNGDYEVFIENGSKSTGLDPKTWSCEAVERGAGEILINSVEQDGTMTGYDTELILMVASAVDVPVIAAGGAGKPEDCVEAVIEGQAAAVAVASLFHYRRTTPDMIKECLADQGIPVRWGEQRAIGEGGKL